MYRSNDQDSYYQFFGACEFELWNHPSLNGRCIALTIWHDWLMLFSVVISREHTECLWGSHLQIPEHIWMDVSYRFIHSLVAAIKGKKRCSWILEVKAKILQRKCRGSSFLMKLRSEACHIDFQSIF